MESLDEVFRELLGVNKRRRVRLFCGSVMDKRCSCGGLNWDLSDVCYLCGKYI